MANTVKSVRASNSYFWLVKESSTRIFFKIKSLVSTGLVGIISMWRRDHHSTVACHVSLEEPRVFLGQSVELLKVQTTIVVAVVHFEDVASNTLWQAIALLTAD